MTDLSHRIDPKPLPPHSAPIAEPRIVSVLGATGSVGASTLDLLARNPGKFRVGALTAQTSVTPLARQARQFGARLAVIGDENLYRDLKEALAGTDIEVGAGKDALIAAAQAPADCVVAAITGIAGLAPALAAIRQGRRIALANKECLVAAGDLVMSEVRRYGTEMLPVDSEHSAVFQALTGDHRRDVERIVLTASGGPFRTWTYKAVADATPEQALKHPNWSMGAKITIDSATMMNKGLELIEALHLFSVSPDQLDAVVHPQSIVHCLVEYRDGAVIAQLAEPDMRTPIAYALSWPARMNTPTPRLDLVKLGALTFEAPDRTRFPALALAKAAMTQGGAATTILNAANEVAVAAFLDGRIGFMDITRTVEKTLDRLGNRRIPGIGNLDDIFEIDGLARQMARDVMAN